MIQPLGPFAMPRALHDVLADWFSHHLRWGEVLSRADLFKERFLARIDEYGQTRRSALNLPFANDKGELSARKGGL